MPDDEQCRTADTDTRDADEESDAEEAPGRESDADEDSSLLETVPLPWLLAAITEAVRPFS